MRRLFASLLLLLLCLPGGAQPPQLSDAAKLLQEGYKLMYQATPDSDQAALEKWDQAMQICVELKDLRAQHDVWMAIGVLHYSRYRAKEALAAYGEGLSLARRAEDSYREAIALKGLGDVYLQSADQDKAGELYTRALQVRRLPDILFSWARLQNTRGQTEKAVAAYEECLTLLPEERQPITLSMLGRLYQKTGQSDKAFAHFEKALGLQEKAEDSLGQILTLVDLASLEQSLGNLDEAGAFYQRALDLKPSPQQQFTIQIGLSMVAMDKVSLADSLKHCLLALEAAKTSGSGDLITRGQIHVASTLSTMGRNDEALEYLEQALTSKDRSLRAHALRSLASVEVDLGKFNEASAHLSEALEFAEEQQQYYLRGPIHRSKARLYANQGHNRLAISHLEQALNLAEDNNDITSQADIYLQLATYLRQWTREEPARARNYLRKGRSHLKRGAELYQQIGDLAGEVDILFARAGIEFELAPQAPRTFQLAEAAAARAQKAGYPGKEYSARNLMARLHLKNDRANEAIPLFEELYRRALKTGSALETGTAISNLGVAYSQIGEYDRAAKLHLEEYELYEKARHLDGMAQAAHQLAGVEVARANWKAAQRYSDRAVELVESVRRQLSDGEAKTAFYERYKRFYLRQIQVQLYLFDRNPELEYVTTAFKLLEQNRARGLLDVLAQSGADPRSNLAPELAEREQSLEQAFTKLELSDRVDEVKRRELNRRLTELEEEIRRDSPVYGRLRYPEPLQLSNVQNELLDSQTMLIQYGAIFSETYRWVVTREGVSLKRIASSDQLRKLTPSLQRGIRRRAESPRAGSELAELLLPPLNKRRLIIVADGPVHRVPFAALPYKGAPLAHSHEIVYLPSVSVLRELRLREARIHSKEMAIIADPVFDASDIRLGQKRAVAQAPLGEFEQLELTRAGRQTFVRLPATDQEAKTLEQLVSPEKLTKATGFSANRSRVLKRMNLSDHRIVHFATHGISAPAAPHLSGLVLSLFDPQGQPVNGYLRIPDIVRSRMNVELVTLSACETAVGQIIEGEGVVGLTRAFMYAGANRLLVSQWSVDDEATAALMSEFYKELLQEKLGPAEALRRAQVKISSIEKWKSPYYWAAFQLQGDWLPLRD